MTDESGAAAAPPPPGRWRMSPTRQDNERLRWNNLTHAEREAVLRCAKHAAVNSLASAGLICGAAALVANLRRGTAPLPRSIRYGAFPLTVFLGAYAGALSTLPNAVRTVASLEDSVLAAELRIELENWNLASSVRLSDLKNSRQHAEKYQKPSTRGVSASE